MNKPKTYKLSDSELKELQAILLDIYSDVAAVCKKYDLKIMLGGGSCLGAVRHKGFIPWDDDMDVNMPRQDYNKLLDVFDDELGEKYDLIDINKKKSGQKIFAKIMKKNTLYLEIDSFKNDSAGIFIDIFPIEALPDNQYFRTIYLFLATYFTKMIRIIIGYQLHVKENSKYKSKLKFKFFGKFTSFMSVYKWNNLYTIFISCCKGGRFCTIPSGMKEVYGEFQPVDTFFPLAKGIFEGREVFLPGNSHRYLTSLYGNYMELPPIQEQKPSHELLAFCTNTSRKVRKEGKLENSMY